MKVIIASKIFCIVSAENIRKYDRVVLSISWEGILRIEKVDFHIFFLWHWLQAKVGGSISNYCSRHCNSITISVDVRPSHQPGISDFSAIIRRKVLYFYAQCTAASFLCFSSTHVFQTSELVLLSIQRCVVHYGIYTFHRCLQVLPFLS